MNIQILNCAGSFRAALGRTVPRTVGKPQSTLSISILQQKNEDVAEAYTNLTNTLVNDDPSHLLLYTDGSQIRTGSNGTGLVAIHAQHPHSEAFWNLGKHVEVYDTELFGIL